MREVAEDELRVHAENVTVEAPEVSVATGVSGAAEAMMRAIHFDDEPEGWGEEVGDGVAEDDLAAEGDAELRAGECGPEEAFGFGGGAPVFGGARREQVTASCG